MLSTTIPKPLTFEKVKMGSEWEGLYKAESGTYKEQTREFTYGSHGRKSWALRLDLILGETWATSVLQFLSLG